MKWQNGKWIWAMVIVFGTVMAMAGSNSGPVSASDQQIQATDLVGKHAQQKVDLFTGSFTYGIPINCAPARNGSEPSLNLGYSSAGDNGWCGMGWELPIGSIERNVRDGFPIVYSTGNPAYPLNQYDDTKGFILDLFGKSYKLFSVATNGTVEYRAETDTDFLRCFFDTTNNKWIVYDKSGNAYYFGETSSSRLSNPKSGWSGYSGTFHWALDQIVSVTGDWTTIAYTNNTSPFTGLSEQFLYPTQIAFNGHTNCNSYSANFTGPNTIIFQTATRTNDWHFAYRAGFRTEFDRLLTNIVCQVGGQNVWSYRLMYGISPATARSLLTNVVVYGYSGSTATPYLTNSFAYQDNPNGVSFGSTILWTNRDINTPGSPSAYNPAVTQVNGSGSSVADLVDMDGDGLPDWVIWDNTVVPNRYLVQKNLGMQANGNGLFGPTNAFGPTSTGSTNNASDSNPLPAGSACAVLNSLSGRIRDLNGDGLPDRVMDYWKPFDLSITPNYTPYTNFAVMLNTGTGFSGVSLWAITNVIGAPDNDSAFSSYQDVEGGGAFYSGTVPYYIGVGLFDINGDSLSDRVMTAFDLYSPETNLYVLVNTGTNFTQQKCFPYKSQNWNGSVSGQVLSTVSSWCGIETSESHFLDLNGDGLPDHVMWPLDTTTGNDEHTHPCSFWAVEYNDGYSFESTNNSTLAPGACDQWPGVAVMTNVQSFTYNGYSYYNDSIIDLPLVGLFDLNGDGLPDRVMINPTNWNSSTNLEWLIFLNNGHGFNTNPIVLSNIGSQGLYLSSTPPFWSMQGSVEGVGNVTTMIDINGDGLLDRVMKAYDNGYNNADTTSNYFLVQLNQGPFPDLLTNVNNGIGGNTAVTYASSTAYDNRVDPTNPTSGSRMPFPRQVVSSISESDGINPPQVTTYSYAGGYYDGPRREFHGFGVVTNIDPTLRTTVTYFHTGGGRNYSALGEYQDTNSSTALGNFAKAGMAYRIEDYGNDNKLYHVQINQVDQTSLGNARYFPFTTLSFDCDYPGNGTPLVTAVDFAYDNTTGNLTNKIEYGQVTGFNPTNVGSFTFTDADTTDTRVTHTVYAAISGNSYIVDHPADDTITDVGNNIVQEAQYTYNSSSGTIASKLTRITPGYYATNSYGSYTSYGLVGSITDPVGVQTTITYDSTYNTFPATTTVGSFTTTTVYDSRSGQVAVSTDPTGVTVSNSFDLFLRPTESDLIPVGSGSVIWTKRYDYPATLKAITSGMVTNYTDVVENDGVGGFTNRTYADGFGRSVQTVTQGENGNYRVISTAYDGRGNAFLTTWPSFATTINFTKPANQTAIWTGYEPAGRVATNRLVTASFSSGAFTSAANLVGDAGSPVAASMWSYVNGTNPWWIVYSDADGKTRRYGLDAFGRTNQIQEVDGTSNYITTLKYDLAGNLTNIVNANGENIDWAYDNAGGVVAMADPYLGQWKYQRDYAGRLRVQTDARGDVVSNSYINAGVQDSLGRLQVQTVYSTNYSNLTLVPAYTNTYVYDSSDDGGYTVYPGLLYKMTDSQGWEKNGYDPRGRLIKTTRYLNVNGQTYTTTNAYDDGDNVLATGYPNGGPTVTNAYFHGRSLSKVASSGISTPYYTVNASAYDEFGHVTNFVYGNTLTTTRSYYTNSKRLQSLASGTSGAVFSRTYTYTTNGDIASLNGTGITNVTVTYDNLHRIKTYSALSGAYGYDATGNMTTNIEGGGSKYTYANPRIEAVRTSFGYTNLYDLCGNMIVRQAGPTNSQALVYDAENRLIRFAQAGPTLTLVKFGYDGNDARLWKWFNQTPTNLQVWIGNIYEEKAGKTLFHVYAGSEQVCTFEASSPLYGGSDTNKVGYYYHEDSLNSSSALSSSSGSQAEVDVYYPFGRTQTASPQAGFQVSRRFTGQILDAETGLYYYNARYYDPLLGRFIQADTEIPDLSNPQSYNRYTYCQNNPLTYNDPSGHADDDDDPTDHLALTAGGNQANMRRAAGGASTQLYNQSKNDLKTVAVVGKTAAELNPVVGAANGAIGATTGKDAVTGEQLTDSQRVLAGVGGMASIIPGEGAELKAGAAILKDAEKSTTYVEDFATKTTKNWSAAFKNEREARALARNKLGRDPVEVAPGKWRSADGKWQYRAKPGDVSDNHIHLEELNPKTGEVIQNIHLRWPERDDK